MNAPLTTRDIAYIALFAALMAALGLFPPLNLPTGVPITAQSMGVLLAGSVLGARRGALSMVLFLVLVAVGLPLLSGGRGGLGVFAGITAGFMLSWPVAAFLIGLLTERFWSRLTFPVSLAINVLVTLVVIYGIGEAWVAVFSHIPYGKALLSAVPFLPGDLAKAILTALIAVTVRRSYPVIRRTPALSA